MVKIISIDGPSASGKGTIASLLAEKLLGIHLNSGAIYRYIAFFFTQKSKDFLNQGRGGEDLEYYSEDVCNKLIDQISSKIDLEEVTRDPQIFTSYISQLASFIARYKKVRHYATMIQKEYISMVRCKYLVLEGRDAAIVAGELCVCRIFITAKKEERAKRRLNQLQYKEYNTIYDSVLRDIVERDMRDCIRGLLPLRIDEGAIVLDSTSSTPEEVVSLLMMSIS